MTEDFRENLNVLSLFDRVLCAVGLVSVWQNHPIKVSLKNLVEILSCQRKSVRFGST